MFTVEWADGESELVPYEVLKQHIASANPCWTSWWRGSNGDRAIDN